MKNYINSGKTLTVTAPTGGISSGDGVLIGNLFGVAAFDAAETENVEIQTTGVMVLPKQPTDVVAVGDLLYWDATNNRLTKTTTSNKIIGVAVAPAGNGAATVVIRLNGIAAQ
jgi:predicted RecA/RadA family phage recombinase